MSENGIELSPHNFINRELSQVDFNRRVLALAQDKGLPLLERLKFIAIVGNNLDEFYMVRVASYVQKLKLGINSSRPDGYTPAMLLPELRRRVTDLMQLQREIMREIMLELEEHGIRIVNVADLKALDQEALRAYFYEEVFPVLTPLAADHARPFPFISNLSLNIGVYVQPQDEHNAPYEFVRIKVPETLPRLVNVEQVMAHYANQNGEAGQFIWIEDLIAQNLDLLFPGMVVVEHYPFRVTRNADIDYEHEREVQSEDISEVIEASVKERRFGSVVRLSVPSDISPNMLKRLIYELEVEPDRDVYMIDGALGSADLFELVSTSKPELKFPSFMPRTPEMLSTRPSIFDAIRHQDILLHMPYDSFAPVEEFFWQAARDPQVIAIKVTLYRVGKNSPIVQALMEARENNKQVAVLVELKARFDEENNLEWARQLEEKGVHVIYGVEKLPVKTHAKIGLVIRKENTGLKRYIHLSTGNYNASTARLYTDVGLFTANEEIAEDATRLFNRLTGYAPGTTYRRLLVAPDFLHKTFVRLIDNEIAAARRGLPAHLIFKMNQLEEDVIIQKLYEASQAGVQVDLIVRGLSCLKAGVPGVSENIRLRSILGRFLEHTRIYYFHNAPEDQRFYAGSADLMRRNLYNRVEVIYPILSPALREKIVRILATDLSSTIRTWEMQPDGSYTPVLPAPGTQPFSSQEVFMQESAGLPATMNDLMALATNEPIFEGNTDV
ncbi:MAG: polyphosphate kinase 1 [Anaerolineae bacterium]